MIREKDDLDDVKGLGVRWSVEDAMGVVYSTSWYSE
jgi:hypothetical protein